MNHVRTLLIIIMLFLTNHIQAQHFNVPDNYSFETKQGYHKYDNDIVKCVNWMESIPYDENNKKLTKASNFLAEWVTGCPYLHFSQNIGIEKTFSNSPQLRIYYMGGWARYALLNNSNEDKLQRCIAGLRSAIKVYKANSSMNRDATIDEIANLDQQGQLQDWVKDRM